MSNMLKYEFMEIPLDQLPPDEELSVLQPDNGLIMSVLQKGVIEPVIYTKYRNKLTLRAGNRRIKALRAANQLVQENPDILKEHDLPNANHLATITAKVYTGIGENDGASIALITNEQRSDNPIDAFNNIKHLQDAQAWDKIQGQVRMNPQKFKRLMTLDKLVERETIFKAVGESKVAAGTMFALAKLSPERQSIVMDIFKDTGKITSKDIKTARQATAEQVLRTFPQDELKVPKNEDKWANKFIVIIKTTINGPFETYGDAKGLTLSEGGEIYRLQKVG